MNLKEHRFITLSYLKIIVTDLLNKYLIINVTENFDIILIRDSSFTKQLLKPFNNISYLVYVSNNSIKDWKCYL